MLGGKYFGRSHDAGLKPVVDGHEHSHECHQCFTASHIALQQPVHLMTRSHIGTNFPDHFFLCAGEFKGQVIVVKSIEVMTDTRKDKPFKMLLTPLGLMKYVELNVEQFFEFQALTGTAKPFRIFWEMNIGDGFGQIE